MEIITNWKAIINNYDIKQDYPFEKFINGEKEKFEGLLEIYPIKDNIFRCFNYFNIEDTKIVIIGQDPYHGPNQATGLCFDINLESGCKYPPSLRNIEKVLGKKPNFEEWASKGVLLLNSSLTVLQGKPGSHLKYWLPFTKYIINTINDKCNNITFIVWGAFALNLVSDVDKKKHNIFISSHPSPFSYMKPLREYPSFIESDIFNKVDIIEW
jgi:uracil-DNA glycosylase